MHRFFCTSLAKEINGVATLDRDETHHARKVLRLEPGDTIGLLDGRGGVGEGVITAYTGGEAVVRITQAKYVEPNRPRIVVATAIPKGSRAQDMIDHLSQVGVARVVPLLAERSVVDPGEGKLERFERTVMESAKQCGRSWVMEIGKPMTPAAILAEPADLKLIAAPGGAALSHTAMTGAQSVLIMIGPEGGWTEHELATAKNAGALPWSLGANVMRIETAAVAAGAIAAYFAQSSRKSASQAGDR
jgi:16S rRNA (uracil1498-N3)-methyltransferase